MPMSSKVLRKAHCPQCNVAMVYDVSNPYRPFCSERCKLIDLGQWSAGAYRIPQVERDNGQDQDEDLQP
jgi:endogenous inhibitor of DNA gyrase (YacG/DUF329 family)